MDEVALDQVDTELQIARLNAMREIMGEMGWRWFIVEVQREVDNALIMLETVDGEQNIGRLQGRIDALRQIIHFEDLVDGTLDAIENNAAEEQE